MKTLILFLFLPLIACGQKYVDPNFSCILDGTIERPMNYLKVDSGIYYVKAGCSIQIDTLRGSDFTIEKYGPGPNPILKVGVMIGNTITLKEIDFIDTTKNCVSISGTGSLTIFGCNFTGKNKGVSISGYESVILIGVTFSALDYALLVYGVDSFQAGNITATCSDSANAVILKQVLNVEFLGSLKVE